MQLLDELMDEPNRGFKIWINMNEVRFNRGHTPDNRDDDMNFEFGLQYFDGGLTKHANIGLIHERDMWMKAENTPRSAESVVGTVLILMKAYYAVMWDDACHRRVEVDTSFAEAWYNLYHHIAVKGEALTWGIADFRVVGKPLNVMKWLCIVYNRREWDDDGSGTVTKKEFLKAMGQLGYEASKKELGELFDSWDPDKSGVIELEELNKQLRAGGAVTLDASLQPGAAGAIELESKNKVATRKAKVNKEDATRLQGVDIDENSSLSVAEQVLLYTLYFILYAHAERKE